MKKILIILTICLLFTGCSLTRRRVMNQPIINQNVSNQITTSYGTFEIPSTWIKREDHSTSSKYFFANRDDTNSIPNNISVEMGTNYYSKEDHMKFRTAILTQMGNQAKAYGMTLTSSGSTTKNGYVVYTFNMEGSSQKTIQHYIIGDYKYVLVHETIWNGNEDDTHTAAKTIVNSFKWKE